jgi:hypothetical protein
MKELPVSWLGPNQNQLHFVFMQEPVLRTVKGVREVHFARRIGILHPSGEVGKFQPLFGDHCLFPQEHRQMMPRQI